MKDANADLNIMNILGNQHYNRRIRLYILEQCQIVIQTSNVLSCHFRDLFQVVLKLAFGDKLLVDFKLLFPTDIGSYFFLIG